MKKSLIAAALGLALSSGAASALQLDFTGNGSISGSQFFDQISFQLGHTLFDNIFEIADVTGNEETNNSRVLMQAHFAFGGAGAGILTYQMIVPVSVAADGAGFVLTDRLVGGQNVSQFALFYDPTPTISMDLGTGYGNLNGASLSTDQVQIATGIINIDPNTAFNLQPASAGVAGTPALRYLDEEQDENPNLGTIGQDALLATIIASGGGRLLIDVLTQNSNYIVSDLVNADPLAVDISLESIGFNTPFADANPDILSGDQVVGETPFYGNVETGLTVRDTFTGGGTGVDNNVRARVNDFACAGSGLGNTTPCDFQAQHAGNMLFRDQEVPEPSALGLVGLGVMVAAGIARRQRRNRGQA